MAVSTAQATAMLGALPGTLYIQAHSGDPGAAGAANTIPGTIRGAFSLPLAAGGQRAKVTNVDLPAIPAAAVVSHVSYWDGPVGSGSFLFSEPLGVTVTFLYQGTLRFTSQVFTITTETGGSQTSTSVVADYAAAAETATGRLLVVNTDTTTQTDSAGAFTGSGANDASSQSDSNAIRLGVVVSDSTSQADTAAKGGAVSDVTDTTSAVDSHTLAQTFRSSATDTAGQSDSDTADVVTGGAAGVSYVGAGTAYRGTLTGATVMPLAVPAVQTGDLILAAAWGDNVADLPGAPAGYSAIASGLSSVGGGAIISAIYTKIAGASAGASTLNVDVNSNDGEGDVGSNFVGRAFVLRGTAATGFIDAKGATLRTGAVTSPISGNALTTAVANDMIVFIGGTMSNETFGSPGGSVDTIVADSAASGSIFFAYKNAPSIGAGAQAAPTVTMSGNMGRGLINGTFAIKPG